MTQQVEAMDIEIRELEDVFDNKENAFHDQNQFSASVCTEKGYEELNVTDLSMKLRYSVSPMSKNYHYNDEYQLSTDTLNNTVIGENINMSSSTTTNSDLSKISKSSPVLVPITECSKHLSVLQPLGSFLDTDINKKLDINDSNENLSLPSTSSSTTHTPEAVTPIKEIPKTDSGSPILRGLKSVLNMFRSSQTPSTLLSNESEIEKQCEHQIESPLSTLTSEIHQQVTSTPISSIENKNLNSSKRSSPLKDSMIFNDDLAKELLWKDETTIIFNKEKIPIHKLFLQTTKDNNCVKMSNELNVSLNASVENVDVSYNSQSLMNENMSEIDSNEQVLENSTATGSDGEFLDCETFTKSEHSLSNCEKSKVNEFTGHISHGYLDTKEECLNNLVIFSDPENLDVISEFSVTHGQGGIELIENDNFVKHESYDRVIEGQIIVNTGNTQDNCYLNQTSVNNNEVTLTESCQLHKSFNDIEIKNENNANSSLLFNHVTELKTKNDSDFRMLNDVITHTNIDSENVSLEKQIFASDFVADGKENTQTNLIVPHSCNSWKMVKMEDLKDSAPSDIFLSDDKLDEEILSDYNSELYSDKNNANTLYSYDEKDILKSFKCNSNTDNLKDLKPPQEIFIQLDTKQHNKAEILETRSEMTQVESGNDSLLDDHETKKLFDNLTPPIKENKTIFEINSDFDTLISCHFIEKCQQEKLIGIKDLKMNYHDISSEINQTISDEIYERQVDQFLNCKKNISCDIIRTDTINDSLCKVENVSHPTSTSATSELEDTTIPITTNKMHKENKDNLLTTTEESLVSSKYDSELIVNMLEGGIDEAVTLSETKNERLPQKIYRSSNDVQAKSKLSIRDPEAVENFDELNTLECIERVHKNNENRTSLFSILNESEKEIEHDLTLPKLSFENINEKIIKEINGASPTCDNSETLSLCQNKMVSKVLPPPSTEYCVPDGVTSHCYITKNVFNLPEIEDHNFKKKSGILDIRNKENKSEKEELNETNEVVNNLNNSHKIDSQDSDTHMEDVNKLPNLGDSLNAEKVSHIDKMVTEGGEVTDELFIDAQAFDFLMKQTSTDIDSNRKKSLFLKFDPLYSNNSSFEDKRSDQGESKKNLSECENTHNKISDTLQKDETNSECLTLSYNNQSTNDVVDSDFNVSVTKPMMVVSPAVNSINISRVKSTPPSRLSRCSMVSSSPAMIVIDRLLSLSNNSLDDHNSTVNSEQDEADLALLQFREILAEREPDIKQLRSDNQELKEKLDCISTHFNYLERDCEKKVKTSNDLQDQLSEKAKINKSMALVVEEYERTIASLIADTQQDKKLHLEERNQLISERDDQLAHLENMEASFKDLHNKYEKSKQVILGYKSNQDSCLKSLKEFEETYVKTQNNYEQLKQHAALKLNQANQELDKINRVHQAEVVKLNALIKRNSLHITSLEESLAQKTRANQELTSICDELINKVTRLN